MLFAPGKESACAGTGIALLIALAVQADTDCRTRMEYTIVIGALKAMQDQENRRQARARMPGLAVT